ncbi:MAG: phosphonate C-P lyase system protein PhnH [Desulfosarcina sp.]|nr:phosphonate C-P lyase system protein PhnH [Desulfobacterales bacterium]
MPHDLDLSCVGSGFSEPVFQSQDTYRLILHAMAFPGRIMTGTFGIGRDILMHEASAAVCLTLIDRETPLWLQDGYEHSLGSWLRFHCGCVLVDDPSTAAFALILEPCRMPSLDRFHSGTPMHPERSTTLILQMDGLDDSSGISLSGPGIPATIDLSVTTLPDPFWEQRQRACKDFPQGLDMVFACCSRLAVISRTTHTKRIAPCT